MRELFWVFFSISISGSIMILELIILKPIIKHRLTKAFQYYIWIFVILRLLIPFSSEINLFGKSVNVIINKIEEISTHQVHNITDKAAKYDTAEATLAQISRSMQLSGEDSNSSGNLAMLGINAIAVNKAAQACTKFILLNIGIVWFIGTILMLIRIMYQYLYFVSKLKKGRIPIVSTQTDTVYMDCCNQLGIRRRPALYISPLTKTPMLTGIFSPQIILPEFDYQINELKYILLHELNHYIKRDIIYKWLIQFTICIHWFNPLIYWMAKQTKQAGELACDEAVIKRLTNVEIREYGLTLINLTSSTRLVTTVPAMSESKKNMKDRLTSIMIFNKSRRKFRFISLIFTLLMLCSAVMSNVWKPDKIMAQSSESQGATQGKELTATDKKGSVKTTDKELDEDYPNYTYQDRLEQLTDFSEYGGKNTVIPFTYQLKFRDKYNDLIDAYNLDAVTAGCDDVELMMKLMNWVCDNFQHNGMSGLPKKHNAYEIIDFCKDNSYAINARGLSILLAELLRLYGIPAKHITCMPKEAVFEDCNVVVHAYSEKYGQWIMLDPTYRLILKNENGDYVNLPMLRKILINNQPLYMNEEAGRNGNAFDMEYYREYMTKNTFRFSCATDFGFGSEEGTGNNIRNMLIPLNYDEDKSQRTTTSEETFWALP